ncbi:hypothetical protein CONLIGDRAFT_632275 [Coniochaeta ligniaria NRRL 30616]|uniref:Zn(2)-C6 fungal-type domain-containing protein n=1 Tax=Coniochaeta ligniaria NRRL 30616 TaxID=1408157 RepID=A0A1J7JK53_9PEZI|nr:hypothetical protein CONLIGDRAFT_632275 [Coniochaeta ligniaria NRRL 30616]
MLTMDQSPAAANPRRRSRTGCQNCRRLHQKCDETKPSCLACQWSQKQCSYRMSLTWGGRPFPKSSFGQCLSRDASVVAIPSSSSFGPQVSTSSRGSTSHSPTGRDSPQDTSFIYGFSRPFISAQTHELEIPPSSDDLLDGGPARLPPPPRPPGASDAIARNPSHLSHLSLPQRVLLDHFLCTVTRSFSLHLATHQGFCMTYLPMALDPSMGQSLLPAILEAAALHRTSLGLDQSQQVVVALRHASVRHFQLPDIGRDAGADDYALATALMLCLCDILSGGEKTDSWRIHLQGATAITRQISERRRKDGRPVHQESDRRKFLWRWCESLAVLSLLSPDSALTGPIVLDEDGDYIDEFHGFSRRLIPAIQEAHFLLLEQQTLQETLSHATGHSHSASLERLSRVIEQRCEQTVKDVMASLGQKTLKFHPSIQSFIGLKIQQDFAATNRAYHHGVLINLRRRVQGRQLNDPEIEKSVEAIITHLSVLDLRNEACPGVAMLQPLFDAGCASYVPQQRTAVLELMGSLERHYAMGNVSQARTFLQDYWLEWDRQLEQGVDLCWDTFIKNKGWELSLY